MADQKTLPTGVEVADFLAGLDNPQQAADCQVIAEMMSDATGKPAVMWGPSIIGFDSYHYKYASGREGDSMIIGVSPRKAATTLYLLGGVKKHQALLDKLGPHKLSGLTCLQIKRLDQVDQAVLKQLIVDAVAEARRVHASS